jgi:hypothetical protein
MAEENKQPNTGFRDLLNSVMKRRWYITAMVLGGFILIIAGIFAAIMMNTAMAAGWKELLMLLLGAFIGSYGKIIDYWFSDQDKDKMLVQKMDEEDGTSLSNTNDMKVTNTPPTPIIPDAFIAGAAAARDLAVTENKQNFELAKDQQEHEQEMEKLKLEHEMKAHRYCQHEWGAPEADGHVECQVCGLYKHSEDNTH